MPVQQPDGAIVSLATGSVTSQAFSRDGALLYSVRNNMVTAYDVAAGTVSRTFTVGTKLGGIDISDDGRYLALTESTTGLDYGATGPIPIYRIDLTTGAIGTYMVPRPNSYSLSNAFGDVVLLADGRALLSGTNQWEQVTMYDFVTGTATFAANTSTYPATFSQAANGRILSGQVGISSAPVLIYSANGSVVASRGVYQDNISGYNAGIQAISADGNRVAQAVSMAIYDGDLKLITKLADRYPFSASGLAFSPDGATLYILDQAARTVFALDTRTWDVTGGYPVGAPLDSFVPASARTGDSLLVSPDGKRLVIAGQSSTQVIDLTRAVSDAGTSAGNDTLTGDSDRNTLYGFEGDDTLDGRGGDDVMHGGLGNDTYHVDSFGDQVVERAAGGLDTVITSLNGYTIQANIERLLLSGNATTANGNGEANDIRANDLGNTLNGLDGDDTLTGGAGNDTLNGGTGVDRMIGGAGNDSYVVDGPADIVIERENEGIDTILTAFTLTLPDHVENLTLAAGTATLSATGNGLANVITGNAGDNILTGLAGDDTLLGGAGDDVLSGGLGADRLDGGAGNDTITFANQPDRLGAVFVNLTLRQGFVNVAAGDTYISIENVIGSGVADFIIGSSDANRLEGRGGDDVLIGSLGADALVGGEGSDTASYEDNWGGVFVNLDLGQGFGNAAQGDSYDGIENLTGSIYDDFFIGTTGANRLDGSAGNDVLIGSLGGDALIGGAGSDTASYEENFGAVFVNLTTGRGNGNAAEGDTYQGIENLKGGLFDDFLIGDAAANRLEGAMGADTLVGNGGADIFVFAHAPGATSAFGSANVDTILDFASGSDRIELSGDVFAGIAKGALAAGAFVAGTAAQDADDRIIYDAATGRLFYDADGSGSGAAALFAVLENRPATIAAGDFAVV